jgi:hypothetical protein
MNSHVLANAKAYCSLTGAICTGLLGTFVTGSPVGDGLTVVAAICTAVVTWRVPNVDEVA